jgi:hypothetical protein
VLFGFTVSRSLGFLLFSEVLLRTALFANITYIALWLFFGSLTDRRTYTLAPASFYVDRRMGLYISERLYAKALNYPSLARDEN